MAEEASDQDTFVSVDIFAPTQSSMEVPHPESTAAQANNDTVSLSEYLGEDPLLEDDLLDAVSVQRTSSYDSRSMRFTTNPQDSAFMWSLADDPSPEIYRQSEGVDQVCERAEETLSIGDDDDVCASFDTGNFSSNFEQLAATPHRPSGPSYPSRIQTDTSSDIPMRNNLPSMPGSSSHHHQVSVSSQRPPRTPARRNTTPRLGDLTDRPPVPTARSSIESAGPETRDGNLTASQPENFTERTTSASAPMQSPVMESDAATPSGENELQLYDPRFQEASRGFSTSVIANPFMQAEDSDHLPNDIVVISRVGPVSDEEMHALTELATIGDPSKIRLVKRLVETISFQRQQLDCVKDSEVNLADSIIQGHVRRYSDLAQERSFALDALVEEVDAQRETITELEDENERLRRLLAQSEDKNMKIENYYSEFVKGFKLSGDIVPSLEKVNEDVSKFRRESIEQSEKKDMQIEDYAGRLLQMESLLADSRKRAQRVESDYAEARRKLDQFEANGDQFASPELAGSSRIVTTGHQESSSEQAELVQSINEQEIELDNLRLLHEKAEEDRKKVQEAFLSLNVDLEEARSKARTLQNQRDSAEAKCRELSSSGSEDKKKFVKLSNEMSKNIVQVVSELDERESEMRMLRTELEDRESAFRSLTITNKDLEDQLQAFTEAALDRSRNKAPGAENVNSQQLVDAVIESLQKELHNAQSLLEERGKNLDQVKRQMNAQDESFIALQKECSRLQAAAAVRRRSGSVASLAPSGSSSEEDRFLRRLSQKLGCKPNNNRDLVEQLAKRVEALMVERAEFQEANEKYRLELSERERALHKLRSEMQAEISALKAEGVHLENLKTRAQEELQSAEGRLLQVLGEGDGMRRESMGDLTVSSVGTRAWLMGDEADTSRRGSFLSSIAGDDTIRWNDPIIDAAVQSVSALIGTKDSLAARNRELRERLQNLINGLTTNAEDGSARAVMIQSKELQDELAGVVNLQQDIIERLAHSHSNTTQAMRRMTAPGDDTLPFINANVGDDRSLTNDENMEMGTMIRAPLGEATRFLNEQLSSTRSLYAEKLRANVELCGVVDEMQEELDDYKKANANVESAMKKLQETHDDFVARLANMTGTGRSIVALEDFIRASIRDMVTLHSELERKDGEERQMGRRISGLVAQKRVLSHMIGIYQSKYKLNVLAPSPTDLGSAKRRLRIRLIAVVALSKMTMLKNATEEAPQIDVNRDYNLPPEIDITQVESGDSGLIEASLAIAAVPRLEKALMEKHEEISRLEASVEALNRSAVNVREGGSMVSDMPRSAYVYEEDLMNRKTDLSRRLQKMIREKDDLEERLSREKQSRMTAEGKVAKYLEKVATYKKRLGKISSHAESKENAYKAAIRYLKSKADKANQNDFNMDDENVAPAVGLGGHERSIEALDDRNVPNEPNSAARAMLQANLAQAESDLSGMHPGSQRYEGLQKYVNGLRLTLQRLEKPQVFTRRAQTDGSTNLNHGPLMG